MAFTPNYTADDVPVVVIDTGTKIVVAVAAFGALFALGLVILLLAMIWKAIKKR